VFGCVLQGDADIVNVAHIAVYVRGRRLRCPVKRGFQPTPRTQRTQRKKRNEMTSLLDRPITAAGDDGVCRWHAAKLWQTRAKLLSYVACVHCVAYFACVACVALDGNPALVSSLVRQCRTWH